MSRHEDEPGKPGSDDISNDLRLSQSQSLNTLFVVFGTLFLIAGILSMLLPVLPGFIFLFLAAACYARGSERFYRWLINNRIIGPYIRDWRAGKGVSMRAKVWVTAVLAITLGTTIIIIAESLVARSFLVVFGLVVVGYLWYLPTKVNVVQS